MFRCFQSNERKDLSTNPELDYFMNEERSDVRFIVEVKPIPALKAFLSVKSRVFHAMFSGEFKESKDKEVVIEDTTYEAFKTFIRFLYNEDLVLKEDNDFELIRELYRLSDRYDVSRFEHKITEELMKGKSRLFKWSKCVSDDDFQKDWQKMHSIAKIGFELKITKLEDNVMAFIDKNFDHFLKKDNKELSELNDLTDGRLFHLMANKFKRREKVLNKSLNQVLSYKCCMCGTVNDVKSFNTSSKCKKCWQLLCDFN